MTNKLISQFDAEELAKTVLQNFVDACHCQNTQDVANVLMKVCSVAGVMMCAVVGQTEAVQRIDGTADFIAKQKFGKFHKETIQ